MQFNKSILGASIIAMIGMVGCGNTDSSSQAPQSKNYTSQVRMDMKSNKTSNDWEYRTSNKGNILDKVKGTDGTGNMGNTRNSLMGTDYDTNYSNGNNPTQISQQNNSSDLSRMSRIQDALNKLQGYSDVTCVVNGDTAIVGCRPNGNNAGYNKQEITNVVKKCDPSINKCEIVNTRDGITKLMQMAEDIRKGKMGTNLSGDFKRMLQDIINY